MLMTKVVVVSFIQIKNSLQVLHMLDMFAVSRYARTNKKLKVLVDRQKYMKHYS